MPPQNPQPFTGENVDLYLRQLQLRARHDFATFRQLKRPTMLWGWWTEEVARQLMHFYRDLLEGRRPKLVMMAHRNMEKRLQFGISSHGCMESILISERFMPVTRTTWVSRQMRICSAQSDRRSIPPYSRTRGLMHRIDNVTRD